MASNPSLEDLMLAAKNETERLEAANNENIKKISSGGSVDSEKYKTSIIKALEDLQHSIVDMARVCMDRTENISTTLDTLQQEIQTVDGHMNSVKAAAGARLADKRGYIEEDGNNRIEENCQQPDLVFETNSKDPLNAINFDQLSNIGLDFNNNLTEDQKSIICTSNESKGFYSQLF